MKNSQKPLLLVVDDEEDVLHLLATRLKKNHYEVITGSNGEEALTNAEKMPALIILDVMMPPPNGFEVCKTLRRDKRFAQTPIILLTAKCSQEDYDLSTSVGANILIPKPYEPAFLLQNIEDLLKESS